MEEYYCTQAASATASSSNSSQFLHHNQQSTQPLNSNNSQQYYNKNNINSLKAINNNLNEDPAILLRNNLRCNIANALNNSSNHMSQSLTNNTNNSSECIIQNSSVNINYNSNNLGNIGTNNLQDKNNNNNNLIDHTGTASVVYAMDRLSPYDCLKQQQQQQQSFPSSNKNKAPNINNNNKNTTNNVVVNKTSSIGPSVSAASSNMSSLTSQLDHQLGNTSPTSTSPSSSIDSNQTYTTLSNSILNGTLTPPPDNGTNSLNSEAINSANVYNHYGVKVENIQSMYDHQTASQLQQQHHSEAQSNGVVKSANNLLQNNSLHDSAGTSSSLITMVQSQQVSNGINGGGNCPSSMMSILSPSRPSNISELSNSSMVSSSSASSTLDSSTNGVNSTNNKRSRVSKSSSDQMQKDCKYFERRKRNNVAAKKSRDARKQREDEIAIRASFLEKENSILKAQLQTLKDEAQQLRILLSQKKSNSMNNSGSGCANCTGMGCSQNKQQMGSQLSGQNPSNLGLINTGYAVNAGLNGLQLTNFDHHADPTSLINLDKHQNQNTLTSGVGPSAASIYLHQTQHRHQII